jgi:hypothetical protein
MLLSVPLLGMCTIYAQSDEYINLVRTEGCFLF